MLVTEKVYCAASQRNGVDQVRIDQGGMNEKRNKKLLFQKLLDSLLSVGNARI